MEDKRRNIGYGRLKNRFLLFLLVFQFSLLAALHSAQMAGVITTIKGDVQILPYQKSTYLPAKTGEFLYEGDTVKTLKKSQIAITLTNGVVMKLNQNTEFSFDVTSSIEKIGSQIKMAAGQIWSSVRPKTKFEIHTPVAIVAVRGTEFDVNYGGGKLDLSVYKGIVQLKNKYGESDVNEGESSSATGDNPPEPPKKMKKETKDKWEEELRVKGAVKIGTKESKITADVPFKIAISLFDANNEPDKTAKSEITVKSDAAGMSFSSDGKNFGGELKVSAVDGIAELFASASVPGANTVIAAADGYSAGQLNITASAQKSKNLKVKVKSSAGDEEILLKFRKK